MILATFTFLFFFFFFFNTHRIIDLHLSKMLYMVREMPTPSHEHVRCRAHAQASPKKCARAVRYLHVAAGCLRALGLTIIAIRVTNKMSSSPEDRRFRFFHEIDSRED